MSCFDKHVPSYANGTIRIARYARPVQSSSSCSERLVWQGLWRLIERNAAEEKYRQKKTIERGDSPLIAKNSVQMLQLVILDLLFCTLRAKCSKVSGHRGRDVALGEASRLEPSSNCFGSRSEVNGIAPQNRPRVTSPKI